MALHNESVGALQAAKLLQKRKLELRGIVHALPIRLFLADEAKGSPGHRRQTLRANAAFAMGAPAVAPLVDPGQRLPHFPKQRRIPVQRLNDDGPVRGLLNLIEELRFSFSRQTFSNS
jgi:hypothetical protein